MKNLEHLNIGDHIAVFNNYGLSGIRKIQRETKTLFVDNKGDKWNKNTGREYPRGDSLHCKNIHPATENDIKKLNKHRVVKKIKDFDFGLASYEDLLAIEKLLFKG